MPGDWFLRNQGHIMRLPTLLSLLAIPALAMVLAVPASAETALNNTASSAADAQKSAAPTANSGAGAKPQTEINSSNAAPGSNSQQSENKPAPASEPETEQAKPASVLVDVDKSTQHMTVFVDGVEKYSWPVSTGMRGYSTPSGTYSVSSMNEMWYSKQWDDAPMPHAIFFTKKGHAIHGSYDVKHLGKAASHGCVRLEPKNATTLFNLVKATGAENVQIVLSGETPGGEAVVASQGGSQRSAKPRAQYPPWFGGQAYADQDVQPPRRGFFGFGRRWRQQNDQGYYAPPRRGGFFQPRAYGY
jgi:lipoprotein-anchoring transpeptidase ErfK/SrfK